MRDSVTLVGKLFRYTQNLPHSLDPHSSRSSAGACGLRRDFGSNLSSSRSDKQKQPSRVAFGPRGGWEIRTLETFYSPAV